MRHIGLQRPFAQWSTHDTWRSEDTFRKDTP